MSDKKEEDIRLTFFKKWKRTNHQNVLTPISKNIISMVKALEDEKLCIHSVNTLLNSYFEDLLELSEEIKK